MKIHTTTLQAALTHSLFPLTSSLLTLWPHPDRRYYKGKGREFHVWLAEHYPKAFAVHFERAEGGRQDLDYDAAVPLYMMRPYIVEYLHSVVFGADHSNVLEDFLYSTFRSEQFVAMTRANALIDLHISKPLRWLSGNSYKLEKWSPISMTRALDLVEQFFVKASTDGSLFLDSSLDIFKSIADEQPLFAAYRKYLYEEHKVLGPDGKTPHLAYKLAWDELLNPQDTTNSSAAVREKTIEYLEVQCVAGLRKLHDPKLALANKLTSQDGANSFAKSSQAHTDTIGLDATNDRLAESVFGIYDYYLRRCPGISMEAASAVAQAMRAKSFVDGGYFNSLPPHETHALVEVARTTVHELRAVDRADHAEHDAYITQKRKSNSQLELDALVKQYAFALSFFKKWKSRGVESAAAMRTKLSDIASGESDERKRTQAQLDYLRLQIQMRVIGLGFDFKTPWSSGKDEHVGTVADLTDLLKAILIEEHERDSCGELPEVAVVPVMKRKTFKELGKPTVQAAALGPTIKAFTNEEILALAQQKRKEMEAAGELDEVADEQPEDPPPLDASIIGTELEICWRYWRTPTPDEIANGEKRKKIGVPMWCIGEVVLVADGVATTERPESAKCKKLAEAGAIRIRWPEDLSRQVPEPETFSWHILQDALWGARNKDVHMGWRFSPAELKKRADAAAVAQPATKRRR